MKHAQLLSKPRPPAPAISLLEKQAFSDEFQRNVGQVAALLNVFAGFKR